MKLETHGLLTILKGATVLFAMVFDAGFVLGPIRIRDTPTPQASANLRP